MSILVSICVCVFVYEGETERDGERIYIRILMDF